MEASHPQYIGQYEVVRHLGDGAFGNTYQVFERNDALRTLYALKWMKNSPEAGAEARFRNEKWALENIRSHPAFPQFKDAGVHLSRPFLVMTFFDGRDIEKSIRENVLIGTNFSEQRTLLVMERLLDAINFLSQDRLLHRDIKDNNIIISSSAERVALIDLGMCKGPKVPEQGHTFWHAGASRFSPPAKLDNPAASEISHEVFSIGVVCYRMLTNRYPWEVGANEDHGDLKRLMVNSAPTPIRELNNRVSDEISTLVMAMINTDDRRRISLTDALTESRGLQKKIEERVFPKISKEQKLRLSRVVRDPIHGDIQMNSLEFAVINCREMQRLRRIRQLGTTHLVYPGAEHSRLSHAVGVVHTVEKIFRAIEMRDGLVISDEDRWVARLAALVHDVGHAPFGHTLEDELGFFRRHDKNSARLERIFGAPDAELNDVLGASEPGRAAMDLLFDTPSDSWRWVKSLLSGPVGADVLDYIDRDSYFCGLDTRVDSAIYRHFKIDQQNGRDFRDRQIVTKLHGNLGFRLDADYAVISILEARYSLFLKIYNHRVKIAAGAMVGKALAMAHEARPHVFEEKIIETLGDDELLDFLLREGTEPARRIIYAYRNRRIFRPVFRANLMSNAEKSTSAYDLRRAQFEKRGIFSPARRLELERSLAKGAGVNEAEIVLYASPKAPGAKTVSQRVELNRGEVMTRDSADERHQQIFRRHLDLWNLYLFVNPEISSETKGRLGAQMESAFGFRNEITVAPTQQILRPL